MYTTGIIEDKDHGSQFHTSYPLESPAFSHHFATVPRYYFYLVEDVQAMFVGTYRLGNSRRYLYRGLLSYSLFRSEGCTAFHLVYNLPAMLPMLSISLMAEDCNRAKLLTTGCKYIIYFEGDIYMSEPIIFISRNKIKAGRSDEFRKHYRDSLPITMAEKPNTVVQLAYENGQATEVTVVRLFPNADALDQQIQGADERSKKTYEYIEPTGIEIFGNPNPATLEKLMKIAGAGIMVSINPYYIDGFIR